jgi:hypothetical protein
MSIGKVLNADPNSAIAVPVRFMHRLDQGDHRRGDVRERG